jgi:hypothetical protein
VDLSNLEVKEEKQAVAMQVVHPITRKPMFDEATKEPVEIVVLSADSSEAANARQKIADKALKARSQGRSPSAADVEEGGIEILAFCTKSWKHVVWEKAELPYSRENAKMIYRKLPWLRQQVDAFSADLNNFLGND